MTFKLDGRLAGPWVGELERSWHASTIGGETKCVTVDLSGVTFVDAEGRDLLSWIWRHGAALKASGCMMKCLVEEIKRGTDSKTGPRF